MPSRDPLVRQHVSRTALSTRYRGADAPETLDARRDLAAARLEQFIRRTVDTAPPLTPEQRDRLALLLRSNAGATTHPSTRPAA
jgi:hypothetical protein